MNMEINRRSYLLASLAAIPGIRLARAAATSLSTATLTVKSGDIRSMESRFSGGFPMEVRRKARLASSRHQNLRRGPMSGIAPQTVLGACKDRQTSSGTR